MTSPSDNEAFQKFVRMMGTYFKTWWKGNWSIIKLVEKCLCQGRGSLSFLLIQLQHQEPNKTAVKFTSIAPNTPNTILKFQKFRYIGVFKFDFIVSNTDFYQFLKISFKGRWLSSAEGWEAFVWDGNPLGSSCRFTSQTNKEILRVDRDHSGRKKHPEGIENVRDSLQLINFITDTWHF